MMSLPSTSTAVDKLVHNRHVFTRERTNIANLDDITLWSSESDGGEVESKDGFEEHHGACSRSKRSKWAERVQMDDTGERADDAGKRRRQQKPFYTRDPEFSE
jgi:hypothetical protein